MCRLIAYQGAPVSPADPVVRAAHCLVTQSYAPTRMSSGTVNADGYGCAWISGGRAVRIARDVPIWQDDDLPGLLESVRTPGFAAVVRSATPGIPIAGGAQPLIADDQMFAFNGAVQPWRGGAMRPLHEVISDEQYANLSGVSDTEAIFRVFRSFEKPEDLHLRITRALGLLKEVVARTAATARVALAVVEEGSIAAARASMGDAAPTLFHRRIDTGHLFASEPLDEAEWTEVPENSVVWSEGSVIRSAPLG